MNTAARSSKRTHELPQPGDRIAEYELVETIGRGGFGAVYKARQARLAREVAVKVLNPHGAGEDVDLARHFMREVDLARRLEHPNIVRLYDAGETEQGLLWMTMELVRGEELATVIHRDGKLPAPRARRIMLQVLSALAEAHEYGIVHRDLKPANIMITRKGADEDVVKLLDFGVGKAFGGHEDAAVQNLTINENIVAGTPRYMAPELLMRENEGAHSDVYAAGLILVEMLQGFPAVEGDSPFELLANQVKGNLCISSSVASSPMQPLIERATRKEWSERYQSALEFHEALKSLTPPRATSSGVSAVAPPPLPPRTPSRSIPVEPVGGALVPLNALHLLDLDGGRIEVAVLEDDDPIDPRTLREDSDPIIEVIVLDSDGSRDDDDTLSVGEASLDELLDSIGARRRTTTATPPRAPGGIPVGKPIGAPPVPPSIQVPRRVATGRVDVLRHSAAAVSVPLPDATTPGSRRAVWLVAAAVLAVVAGGSAAVVSATPDRPSAEAVGVSEPDTMALAEAPPLGSISQQLASDATRPGDVEWRFETRPAGARVYVGGRLACEHTPCTAELQHSRDAVDVRVSLDGHQELVRTVRPRRDGRLALALERTDAATAALARDALERAAAASAAARATDDDDTTREAPHEDDDERPRTQRRARRSDDDDGSSRERRSRNRKKKHASDPFAIQSD